jgi:hypothetical protein
VGRLRRIPVVYVTHTILETELRRCRAQACRTALPVFGRWTDGNLPGHCDHIVAVTSETADRLTSFLPHGHNATDRILSNRDLASKLGSVARD